MKSLRDMMIPGGWSERAVTVGPFKFELLTPSNPDAVLEELEVPGAMDQPHLADPYWAKLWPAAPLLAEALVKNAPPRGTRVLELGCGSGLVGITALALGLRVTFSDYVPLAVELALENAARNGFANARGLRLDWRRRERDAERFELIVAADVTYDRSNLDVLLDVVDERLEAGGKTWFGDAGRSPAPDFVERAIKCGWQVASFDEQHRPTKKFVFGQFKQIVLQK
jgi:predicted nicotinamide N-methyase